MLLDSNENKSINCFDQEKIAQLHPHKSLAVSQKRKSKVIFLSKSDEIEFIFNHYCHDSITGEAIYCIE